MGHTDNKVDVAVCYTMKDGENSEWSVCVDVHLTLSEDMSWINEILEMISKRQDFESLNSVFVDDVKITIPTTKR